MFISKVLDDIQWGQVLSLLFFLWIIYAVTRAIYNITIHPLAGYPGPILAQATSLPMVWYMCSGNQVDWLVDCHKKYGSVVRVSPRELTYITEEAWRDIYSHDSPSAGRKWEGLYRRDNPQMQTMQGADDKTHTELRRIFSPAFSEKSLRDQEPTFKKTANMMVDRIKRYQKENPTKAIDMSKFFMYVTFDIMGDFTFAQPFGLVEKMEYLDWIAGQTENLAAATFFMSAGYLTFLKPIVNGLTWIFLEQMNAPLKFAAEQVKQRIKRSAPEKGSDIWALTYRENKFDRKLTLREMHTHAMLLLLAGTETSATTLTALLWYLDMNPTVSSTLIREIRGAFESVDDITLQRCTELRYLQACIEEVLRIAGPIRAGLPRVTPPQGMVIDGKFVAGETVVWVPLQAANVSADNFRDPERFIPERWIGDEYKSDKKAARQPFSIGARDCLGKSFAYHEMRLLVATLLFSLDPTVLKESDAWGVNQKVRILVEKKPLWMNFTERI